jgi:hypothetical protein
MSNRRHHHPRRSGDAPRADPHHQTRAPFLGNTVFDAQQAVHLPRLKNPALRVNERNAVAAKLKPGREIGGIEDAAS